MDNGWKITRRVVFRAAQTHILCLNHNDESRNLEKLVKNHKMKIVAQKNETHCSSCDLKGFSGGHIAMCIRVVPSA